MARADAIYECAEKAEWRDHPVTDNSLFRFWALSYRVRKALDSVPDICIWRPFLRWMWHFRAGCTFTPLPFDHPAFGSLAALDEVYRFRALADATLQGTSAEIAELLALARGMILSRHNPIFHVLPALQGPNTALVIGEGRFLEHVHNELVAARIEMSVVSPHHLRSDECYDHLVILARHVPDFILAAPRAPLITVLRYAWVPAPEPVRPALSMGDTQGTPRPRRGTAFEHLEDSFVASVRRALEETRISNSADDGSDVTTVEAITVLLDGGEAVWLDCESRALVIDTEAARRHAIWQYRVRDLQPGMFLLLRSGGGGDYIAPIADRILRERANEARRAQRHWKQLLRDRIRQDGINTVVSSLRHFGARRAADYNVRHWASDANIRTQDRQDFDAIMRYIGLADQADRYWSLMTEIDRAHRRAGHQIRKELLRKVRQSDPRQLHLRGRMDFALDAEGLVSITAYRIVHILADVVPVPSSRLGRPFNLEEATPWLE